MSFLCAVCKQQFGSTAAFDQHRVGSHDYTSTEGLNMSPPREDGRRCLSTREIEHRRLRDGALMFGKNSYGQWSLLANLESARKLNEGKETSGE